MQILINYPKGLTLYDYSGGTRRNLSISQLVFITDEHKFLNIYGLNHESKKKIGIGMLIKAMHIHKYSSIQ